MWWNQRAPHRECRRWKWWSKLRKHLLLSFGHRKYAPTYQAKNKTRRMETTTVTSSRIKYHATGFAVERPLKFLSKWSSVHSVVSLPPSPSPLSCFSRFYAAVILRCSTSSTSDSPTESFSSTFLFRFFIRSRCFIAVRRRRAEGEKFVKIDWIAFSPRAVNWIFCRFFVLCINSSDEKGDGWGQVGAKHYRKNLAEKYLK